MKILISDPMDESARKYLKDNGLDFDYLPTISAPELLDSIYSYEGILVRSRTKVTGDVISKGKSLKIIGRIGSGYDNIDIETCKSRKITVVNSPDANSVAVAELTIGLVIAVLRDLPKAINSMKEGSWIKNEIWGSEISGKTVGIIGYGYVGTKAEKLFSAFGARTLVYSRSYKTANLQEIFSKSDIITIHLTLSPRTQKLIGHDLLSLMKPNAIIINISRGKVIDEDALYQTLRSRKIKGAILDVFWQEPLPPDSRWRKLDNVILTPHIGAATREALGKASMSVVKDIVRFAKGEKVENKVL